MGCTDSKSVSVNKDSPVKIVNKNNNIQDEARSFLSKLGAIKMLIRSADSRDAFLKYLQEKNKAEFLQTYQELEEIKALASDQVYSRTSALVGRQKAIVETADKKKRRVDHLVWDTFGKLRQIDTLNLSHDQLMSCITITQNDLLSRVVLPFEGFLQSKYYKEWKDKQLEQEKKTRGKGKSSNSTQSVDKNSSIRSRSSAGRLETCSIDYPQVLVVDDSLITLKITGLTLESDGHKVERASNGQVALELLKSRSYDVVLIDLNMPVMDGFETVQLFREHESNIPFPGRNGGSDVSSISEDSFEEDEDEMLNAVLKDHHRNLQRQQEELIKQSNYNNIKKKKSSNGLELYGAMDEMKSNKEVEEKQWKAPPSHGTRSATYHTLVDVTKGNSKDDTTGKDKDWRDRQSSLTAGYHQLIIGMSTNVDEETRAKAISAGMDYFMPKPFTLQKFIETIMQSRFDAQVRNTSHTTSPR